MKITSILILFFTLNIIAYSQTYDLVVKNSDDSLACNIDSIGQSNIYIELKHQGKWIHTRVSKTDIKEYKYGAINKKDVKFKSGSTQIVPGLKVEFKAAKMNAISFNIAGISPIIGVSYERVLSKKASFEFGIGIPSIGIGLKFYPYNIKEQKAMFHFGFTAVYFNSGDGEFTGGQGSIIYIPLGLSYYGTEGFNFGVDIGPGRLDDGIMSYMIPYGSIRLGKRF